VSSFSQHSQLCHVPILSPGRVKRVELFCKPGKDVCQQIDRRDFIKMLYGTGFVFLLRNLGIPAAPLALADDGNSRNSGAGRSLGSVRKPWAPAEALLPATRVRLLLDRAVDLAEQIAKEDRLHELDDLLKRVDAILVSESDSPNDNVRWAFNVYTASLRFDEAYMVTASEKDRSEYIRKYDGLPDVKQVITADLDLRDLYRNQVLTAIDDARAELRYQKKEFRNQRQQGLVELEGAPKGSNLQQPSLFDGEELFSLLLNAQSACRDWFSMISDEDVKKALDVVLSEQTSTPRT